MIMHHNYIIKSASYLPSASDVFPNFRSACRLHMPQAISTPSLESLEGAHATLSFPNETYTSLLDISNVGFRCWR